MFTYIVRISIFFKPFSNDYLKFSRKSFYNAVTALTRDLIARLQKKCYCQVAFSIVFCLLKIQVFLCLLQSQKRI